MKTIAAVYEDGIFRPVEPVTLPEGYQAEVIIPANPTASANTEADTGPSPKETPYEIMMRIAALPGPSHEDGFSGADHDEVLYGKDGAA